MTRRPCSILCEPSRGIHRVPIWSTRPPGSIEILGPQSGWDANACCGSTVVVLCGDLAPELPPMPPEHECHTWPQIWPVLLTVRDATFSAAPERQP